MTADTELERQLEYLATELFGWTWEQRGAVPRECWWDKKGGLGIWHEQDLLTGNGMLEIIEAMRRRGYWFDIADHRTEWFEASFMAPKNQSWQAEAFSMPEAIARAAYAALTADT